MSSSGGGLFDERRDSNPSLGAFVFSPAVALADLRSGREVLRTMVEREMQELLWLYPERFLNEPLKQFAWEESSDIGRADLVFEDRHGRLLIIEVKRGKLPRGAIDQLLDYFGMMKQRQDKERKLMLSLETRIAEDVTVIRCKGRIAYGAEATALSREIAELAPQTRRVVIDLSSVEMIDAAGLGALISIVLTAQASQSVTRPCPRQFHPPITGAYHPVDLRFRTLSHLRCRHRRISWTSRIRT
jgi:ABC-type transporter Mla MlaB component